MNRRLLTAAGASLLLVATMLPAASAAGPNDLRPLHLRSTDPAPISKLDRSLVGESGRVTAVITLVSAPVATVKGNAPQKARGAKIALEQDGVLAKLQSLDGTVTLLARTKIASNALLVEADSAKIAELASDARVAKIARVRDYELDLSETVPYIGATAVHGAGFTGDGITVAVLDSGVDYTHAAFGGPGDITGYKTAYGTKTKHTQNRMINESYKGVKLFPTPKVIGGWDFVGEAWVGGVGSPPLRSDPDPIDCSPSFIGCGGGHGTHVADIIAGASGVAPDADLLAIKVCSSITTSCSGVALLQGMDFALDPNGDGTTGDRADVLNMSLGSQYGQSDDDSLSAAVAVASAAGTLVVASAGNGGDKPYVTGTPAAAPSALSVAQTAVPSSTGFAMLLSTNGGVSFLPREAVFQSWSHELDFSVTNVPVQFGDGAGGNTLGCDPFAAGSLTGKVVLVDRGVCNFSLKIANIAGGGGAIGVIGLVAPGDPFDGSLGLCPSNLCAQIPGYMVSQSTATAMKGASARVSFDPANGIPLVMHMVGSSSRGPDNDHNLIKPEIGAPGASVSAEVGTGTGTTSFGGTSGAAPMVTGSGALLLEAFPSRSALEIKAVLINTGFTEIRNRPVVFGGELAPITRIGGGEVRVDRALATQAAAWDANAPTAALNFGFHDVTSSASVTRTVIVRNYGGTSVTYNLTSTFRFVNDQTNGAVTVTPSVASIVVPAHADGTFDVTITVNGALLRTWTLDSGINGASAAILQSREYDGYVWLDADGTVNDIHLPWQVLPRKSGNVSSDATSVATLAVDPPKPAFGGPLDGAQEVPAVVTAATGQGTAVISADNSTIWYVVDYSGLSGAVAAAHIHTGAAGVAGGVILPLVVTASPMVGTLTAANFTASGSITTFAQAITALKTAGTYFNLHTAANPGGEIRGQINAKGNALFATLAGGQEVPAVTTSATGNGWVLTSTDGSTLTYFVAYSGLSGALAQAHIHTGAAGVAGGVILPLVVTPSPMVGTLTAANFTASGSITTFAQAVAAIAAGNTYFNLHTAANPGGEIRGQIGGLPAGGSVTFTNGGVGTAWLGSYGLIATSPNDADTGNGDDQADVDLRYVGVRQFTDAINDFGCDSSIAIQFAVNTWDRQVHANGPALFEFDLDYGQDGTIDAAVFNFDLSNSGALSDGRNFTWAIDLVSSDPATAFWPTVHATNSGNTVLTVCGEQIGLDAANVGELVDVIVLAADWYNSGAVTDFALATIAVGADRYAADFGFGGFGTSIAGGASETITISDNGAGTSPSETGLLVLTDETLLGILGFGSSGGAPQEAEAIAIEVSGP